MREGTENDKQLQMKIKELEDKIHNLQRSNDELIDLVSKSVQNESKEITSFLEEHIKDTNTRLTISDIEKKVLERIYEPKLVIFSINKLTSQIAFVGALEQVLGLSIGDKTIETYQDWVKLFHKDDQEKLLKKIENSLINNELISGTFRIISKSKKILILDISGIHLQGNDKNKAKVLGIIKDITEYRQSIKAQKDAELRWEFAVNGADLGLWDWNLITNEVYFSDKWKTILGYTPDEIKNEFSTWNRLVVEEDREQTYDKINQHIEGKTKSYECRFRMICKDGSYKWILAKGKIIEYDELGKPLRMIGVHNDITEQIFAANKLQDKEEKFRLIFENMSSGFSLREAVYDENDEIIDFRFVEYNPMMEKISSMKTKDLIGKTIKDLFPEYYDESMIYFCDLVKNQKSDKREYYEKNTDKYMEIYSFSPKKGFIATFINDITDRRLADILMKKSEEELAKKNEELKGILNSASEIAIISTDKEGLIKVFNKGAEKMLGYSAGEIINKTSPAIFHDKSEVIQRGVELSLELNEKIEGFEVFVTIPRIKGSETREWTYIKKDGSRITVSLVVTAIFVGDEIDGYLGIATDITARKKQEEVLMQIAKGVSASTGEQFFKSLSLHLGEMLNADYVLVGEFGDDTKTNIHTIAVSANGNIMENILYDLRGTPCNNVLEKGVCTFPHSVQDLFPEDILLVQMGVHSYVGTPLFDINGHSMGLIAVLYKHNIENSIYIENTLTIFAARAAVELERLHAEVALKNKVEEYKKLYLEYTELNEDMNETVTRIERVNKTLQEAKLKSAQYQKLIPDIEKNG